MDTCRTAAVNFPVMKLTEKSNAVLFNKEKAFLSAPVQVAIVKEPVIYQQHDYEKPLFEELKKLRNQDCARRKCTCLPDL
jgi:ATP-dependent DNA helicase RecQ